MQTNPYTQLTHGTYELGHARLNRSTPPESRTVLNVHTISAGVLRDNQQFLYA